MAESRTVAGPDRLSRLPPALLLMVADKLKPHGADSETHGGADSKREGCIKALTALSQTSVTLNKILERELYKAAGTSATVWGAYFGRIDVLEHAISHGADINEQGTHRGVEQTARKATIAPDDLLFCGRYVSPATPLGYAVISGRNDVIRWLLEHGADINQKIMFGGRYWRPLHLSIALGHTSAAEILSDRGAAVGEGCPNPIALEDNWHAIHCAALYANTAMVERLVGIHGPDILTATAGSLSVAHIASGYFRTRRVESHSRAELISLLARLGADLSRDCQIPTPWYDTRTPLQSVLETGNWELAAVLIENGADISRLRIEDLACSNRDMEYDCHDNRPKGASDMRALAQQKDRNLRVPLLEKILAQPGFDVNDGDPEETALYRVVFEGDFALALILLDFGASPSMEVFDELLSSDPPWGPSLREDVIRKLFTSSTGTSVFQNETCLARYVSEWLEMSGRDWLVQYQHDTISIMLKSVSPDAKGLDGRTPILSILNRYLDEKMPRLYGCYRNYESESRGAWGASTIILLLEHGASLDIQDSSDRTAIDYALEIAKTYMYEEEERAVGVQMGVDILRCLSAHAQPGCISKEMRERGTMAIAELFIKYVLGD
ncbi:ankyrin repeat-containing domain protein [Cercophora newfieldiana]|uniref:Ankyrin repeat-containing domain protein n=1 Tax=Cercophora newfieldiana TaxID=92897 RepID=A0AA40CX86_9PEZI|nr:ankyrin repeat-containing domain protein [Cercophora newfieldiana]